MRRGRDVNSERKMPRNTQAIIHSSRAHTIRQYYFSSTNCKEFSSSFSRSEMSASWHVWRTKSVCAGEPASARHKNSFQYISSVWRLFSLRCSLFFIVRRFCARSPFAMHAIPFSLCALAFFFHSLFVSLSGEIKI